MPITKTITLYHYAELSERAKGRAADWWRQCIDSSDYDSVIEDVVRIGECLGITFDQRSYQTVGGKTRYEPDINWSGFSSQGDGASFNGDHHSPEWNMVAKVTNEAPQDLTLHSIAQKLHELQAKYDFKLRAVCKYSSSGMSYAHSGWMDVTTDVPDNDEVEVAEEDCTTMKEQMRRFADWIYKQLNEQNDYLHSEENIADVMAANEYTFEEDGTRRD